MSQDQRSCYSRCKRRSRLRSIKVILLNHHRRHAVKPFGGRHCRMTWCSYLTSPHSPSARSCGKYDHTPIGFRGSRSLSALRQLTIIPTAQDEPQRYVQIVWALPNTAGQQKRTGGTRNATATQRGDAQKKKRSLRQKIDTQILGSKIVNDNN